MKKPWEEESDDLYDNDEDDFEFLNAKEFKEPADCDDSDLDDDETQELYF